MVAQERRAKFKSGETKKGFKEELSEFYILVNIENGRDMLRRETGAVTVEVLEEFDYDSNLILLRPALRR